MLQSARRQIDRQDSGYTSALATRRAAEGSVQAEAVLRDIAFVLHLTQKVRQSMQREPEPVAC